MVPLNTSITISTTLVSFLSRRNEITGHPANLLVLNALFSLGHMSHATAGSSKAHFFVMMSVTIVYSFPPP